MPLNIVLVEPEIHTNTGNIGRLSLASNSNLHLVKPLGFELSNKRLKRAGLDYWRHISLFIYDDFDDFLSKNKNKEMVFLSSHAKKEHWNIPFKDNMFLIFGKESEGLSNQILKNHLDKTFRIPIYNKNIRSINLANAVSIVVYEGLKSI
jgi:tRNA (cytidine/uridine-2'-O-)-methyltransferase|tara:strand:+ start:176 stop:625 length:450 start_codon:yes stop_codon:yes gene_type:complete